MEKIRIQLTALEKKSTRGGTHKALMEFHIDREVRRDYGLKDSLFALTGNVILADIRQARDLAAKFNAKQDPKSGRFIRAGELYVMGLIDEILHYVVSLYREEVQPDAFDSCLQRLETNLGETKTKGLLTAFSEQFPPKPVYTGEKVVPEYLESTEEGESCRSLSLEEAMMLSLANLNRAFKPFKFMFDDKDLTKRTIYPAAIEELKEHFKLLPPFGPYGQNLWDMLRSPALASDTLAGQLEYMRTHWGLLIGKFTARMLIGLDIIKEEEKPSFFGPGPSEVLSYNGLDEYERFSPDQEWMPRTVLIAKSSLVWLFQLSQKYGREINRLDQIPDEELDELARRGFTGLWLIGVWERSNASKTIKQWTGNPEAAASAYSLYDYDIAGELGGWGALASLRDRCMHRGIRVGSDMVPNHTGIDSRWMVEHPDRFLQLPYPPFPTYNYNCGNLSGRDDITVQIEEHYFTRSDAAVVFKRIDNRSGETRFIYHGNDGTSMPWNDTAQIDFLNPEAREAVIRTIVGVCQQFSIVRFDAAMTLAKRHIQRLWYPAPGHGGAIASRAEHALSNEEFNRRIPNEFWREVVDRCAAEAPHTLLLAEAFWMMEGYFVRTLGMHRVYNSAFMNMLKNEENSKYRATIKNTLEFDPEILKRFVNFMNNPDEETAVAQFGKGDKYFGICTLLVTMPGLPMFGHGQIEGFEEKYGMEYRRAYRDEQPDGYLVDRHEREIFPLMKRRALFSGSSEFRLYDLFSEGGSVNENVFAYTNRAWINGYEERALIFYNNSYYETAGWIKVSDPPIPMSDGKKRRDSLHTALALHDDGSFFTLFREQRTNLWYIRSSKAINENGFFVALDKYETQVFIDIYEVQDDARGRWARLHHDLQGRGVIDPHSAIKDLFLGDLYYRFSKLLKDELVNRLHRFFTKKQNKTELQAFIESIKEPAEKYFDTAAHFIGGADGKFDPWIPPEGIDVNREFKKVNKTQLWDDFRGYVERLAGLSAYLNSAGKTPGERLLKQLAGRLKENRLLCAAAMGYSLLAILRPIIGKGADGSLAADLAFAHWELDRKLKELFRAFGATDDEVWRIGEITRAVLRRTTLRQTADYSGSFDPELFAATIIGKNYLYDDFRILIGLNHFNDVTWFNKEAFESAMFYGKLFYALEGDSAFISGESAGSGKTQPWAERVERIAKITEALEKAEAGSGYQLDKLVQLLTVKETAKAAKGKAAKPKAAAPRTAKETAKPKTSKTKPAKAAPKATAPKTEKPKIVVPKTAKPKAAKPKVSAPKTTKEAAKPKAATSKTAKPKTVKPKAVAPKISKPKASSPKATKAKASAPKTSKEKTTKPKTSGSKTKSGKGTSKGKGKE
ncbi:MAG: alpha-amylase family glycosyl hydrolase [Treponema sp.]|nr:alpha-amylase family glycosyl hydrolase [Treponema sp.]